MKYVRADVWGCVSRAQTIYAVCAWVFDGVLDRGPLLSVQQLY